MARGRPLKHPGKVQKECCNFRISTELLNQLRAAAASAGRPVSDEVRHRLELSFDRPAFVRSIICELAAGVSREAP